MMTNPYWKPTLTLGTVYHAGRPLNVKKLSSVWQSHPPSTWRYTKQDYETMTAAQYQSESSTENAIQPSVDLTVHRSLVFKLYLGVKQTNPLGPILCPK
jgi:hypothetical protein